MIATLPYTAFCALGFCAYRPCTSFTGHGFRCRNNRASLGAAVLSKATLGCCPHMVVSIAKLSDRKT